MSSEPRLVVTLIHGTWGRGVVPFRWFRRRAAWTEKSELRSSLETVGAHIEHVTWSGANTFRARRDAAERIRHTVTSTKGYDKHFLVAHSHGGTAAMMALKSADIAGRVDGLICLATPVPLLRPRKVFQEVSNRTCIAVARPVITVASVTAYFAAMGEVDAQILASMAMSDGSIYIRSHTHLYRLGA